MGKPSATPWTIDDDEQRQDARQNGHAKAASAKATEPAPPDRLVVTRMSDVKPQAVNWLWRDRIPLGMFSLIVGHPGEGKTWWMIDTAARISTGTPFPDTPEVPNPRGNVVLFISEDSLAHTIAPRLDGHSADRKRVYVVEAVREVDREGERIFDLQRDLELLGQHVDKIGNVRMIGLDPIGDYMSARSNADKSQDVRLVLRPLAHFAEKHGLAIVGIRHMNKRGDVSAGERIDGAGAWRQVSRAIWFICRDQQDENRRLFIADKLNIAKAASSLAFAIEDGQVRWSADPVNVTLNDALKQPREDDGEGEQMKHAIAFLRERLAGGEVRTKELSDAADTAGISPSTLKRAKARLGCKPRAVFAGQRTVWFVGLGASGPCSPDTQQHGLDELDGPLGRVGHVDHVSQGGKA